MPLNPDTRLGSYEIVSLLGAGGMGEVYRAKDLKLGRDVTLHFVSAARADEGIDFKYAPDEIRPALAQCGSGWRRRWLLLRRVALDESVLIAPTLAPDRASSSGSYGASGGWIAASSAIG